MSKTRRKFTREFKVAAVKRLQSGYPVGRVARELEVNPSQLQLWRREFQEQPNAAFSGKGRGRGEETRVAELERKIGQQALEIDFLKGCLTDRGSPEVAGGNSQSALCLKIRQERERGNPLTTAQMTALAGVSRASYYRCDSEAVPAVRDTELGDAIQRIALRFPGYSRPRITAGLKRQGWEVNHKRVGRILSEDNLLCLRKENFQVTTNSKHGFTVNPNLKRNFVPTARNQLWVADITYIRLAEEFVYLAVVLDAYSRLVIGWALERTLEAKLATGALQMALKHRGAAEGLIHDSDRCVQYACGDYTQLLKDHGLRISMSRKGNPYDNAKAESFMKTLKHEEVNRVEYRDLADARHGIRHYLERTHNRKRLHSALGYRPPSEFDGLPQNRKVPA